MKTIDIFNAITALHSLVNRSRIREKKEVQKLITEAEDDIFKNMAGYECRRYAAFRNRRTKKLVAGTYFGDRIHQIYADDDRPPFLMAYENVWLTKDSPIKVEQRRRHISDKTFEIVCVYVAVNRVVVPYDAVDMTKTRLI
jgi:hypothetical protein